MGEDKFSHFFFSLQIACSSHGYETNNNNN